MALSSRRHLWLSPLISLLSSLHRDSSIEVARDQQIRLKILGHIVQSRRQQEANSKPVRNTPDVVRNDLGSSAVENGRELVGDNPLRFQRDCQSQSEAVPLTLGQFLRRTKQQRSLSQATQCQEMECLLEGEIDGVDDRSSSEVERVQAKQAGFTTETRRHGGRWGNAIVCLSESEGIGT